MPEQNKLSPIISHETIEPITVLLIDDSQVVRQMVTPILKSLGLKIVGEASNGREGLALYEKLMPNLVFLDVIMPSMSGIEVLKRIKEINPETIVVMLTSIADREEVLKCKQAGAFTYVLKPSDRQKFERVVSTIKQKLAKDRENKYD
jgi:two-component system chemotaxis response regulator CheY